MDVWMRLMLETNVELNLTIYNYVGACYMHVANKYFDGYVAQESTFRQLTHW